MVKIQDGTGDRCIDGWHTGDQDRNHRIGLPELLRVIQFYNSGGFRCADDPAMTEDGYVPAPWGHQGCCPHDSDYDGGADWDISLSELLQLIRLYNSGGYY